MLHTRLAIGTALIATLALIAGCSNGGPATHTISGQFTLRDYSSANERTPCRGLSGYSDINAGTTVLISNEKGTIIATGELGTGSKDIYEDSCNFPYKVTGVPAAKIYSIEVSHRGKSTYSLSDLKKNNWKANLTLG